MVNIFFNIEYYTVFGEELLLCLTKESGTTSNAVLSEHRMKTTDGCHWSCHIVIDDKMSLGKYIDYKYCVDNNKGERRVECNLKCHRLDVCASSRRFIVFDKWNDTLSDNFLYTSAFTECINKRNQHHLQRRAYRQTVTLKVKAPQLRRNQCLGIVGGNKTLGNWQLHKAVLMSELNMNEWSVSLDASVFDEFHNEESTEFKFVAIEKNETDCKGDKKERAEDIYCYSVLWENGPNRRLAAPPMIDGDETVYELEQPSFEIPNIKLAGTLIPVFSLRTDNSFGVGDFGDLKKMIDFMSLTGQKVLQLLPINDTTSSHTLKDSYPYNCVSVFAIHPMYCDLRQLPEINDAANRLRMQKLQKQLNALHSVDYEKVNDAKIEYLRIIYNQKCQDITRLKDYKKFIRENESWLIPYAYYCYLRDLYSMADFSLWPDNNVWDESLRQQLTETRTQLHSKIKFHLFVQYILSSQLTNIHNYARSKGVILKGDIPIGVSRFSCDVWMAPRYFNLDSQSGAPPDDFSRYGQNWGFPTYNWDEMLRDGGMWWRNRLSHMSKYFDAYRIDHILGFFRIWNIPMTSIHALLGQFVPSLPMTKKEIEAYGLSFCNSFLKPLITDELLKQLFGPHSIYVSDKYLIRLDNHSYEFKSDYDTERKICDEFKNKQSEQDLLIRDGLYTLVNDVLFISDRKDATRYNPRICAHNCYAYQKLCDEDKNVFNKIYEDYYYHRHNQFWYTESMKKLPMCIHSNRMLACAEDLGMVPECVQWAMNVLQILSLEIQSMPKTINTRFGYLSNNPYRSVCTISTHDMATLRMWWDVDNEQSQYYYNNVLGKEGQAPHPLSAILAREILEMNLKSPSMLCVLSFQDWMSISKELQNENYDEERINTPSNPDNYWNYRMHLNIEQLISNKEYVDEIRTLIQESCRLSEYR